MSRFLILGLFGFLLAGVSLADVLRSAPEIRKACAENRTGISFIVEGQVLLPPNVPRGALLLETDAGHLSLYDTRTNASHRVRVGDRLRVVGCLEPSGNSLETNPNGYDFTLLSHEDLPEPPLVPLAECLKSRHTGRRIAIRGVVKDVFPDDIDQGYVFLVLENGTDTILLTCVCLRDKLPAFRALLGYEVVAVGLLGRGCGRFKRLSQSFAISGPEALRSVSGSPTDLFAVQPLTVALAGDPQALAAGGRRKTVGTVLTCWQDDHLLLRTRDGATVKVELATSGLPPIHAVVEVVGLPETDLLDIRLSRAIWRPTNEPSAEEEVPRAMTLRDIFTNRHGRPIFATQLYGQTLRVTGTLKRILRDRDEHPSLMLVDGDQTLIINGPIPDGLAEGCRLQVTGVCAKDSDVWRPGVILPKIRGLFLVTRTAEDVVLLAAAPWWTPIRFACVLVVLLGVLIAILIWNATLRVLVTRKSRALLRAETAKLEETLKIDERTRLAAELHDYLAQNLTVISYQVSAAESALVAGSAEAVDCLKTADRMLLSCRTDLRRCLWDLKSDALNESDFTTAIESTIAPVAGTARLHVRFVVNRNRLSDSTAHAVLSICRELVANAVRHGKADSISIAGEHHDGILRFSVRDDGCGFVVADRPGQSDGHFGLDGVAERIKRFNGRIEIDSTPGKGTRVVVTLRPKETLT